MEIKELKLSDIKPYWRNSRRGNVEAVKKSIELYGYNQLIVVDKENVIIVGHTRYKALLELGFDVVKVFVSDLPEEKVKEYRIADNKTSDLAIWDHEALSTELKTLTDTINMTKFFTEDEIDDLINKTIGVNGEEIGSDQIMSSKETLENMINDNFEKKRIKFVKITCPECGKQFDTSI